MKKLYFLRKKKAFLCYYFVHNKIENKLDSQVLDTLICKVVQFCLQIVPADGTQLTVGASEVLVVPNSFGEAHVFKLEHVRNQPALCDHLSLRITFSR